MVEKNVFWKEFLFLGVLSSICFGLSLYRVKVTQTGMFLFLNWNLFLAFVPYIISVIVLKKHDLKHHKLVLFGLVVVWLLFFPNAPYIITDLLHLKKHLAMPTWFDLLLILSFAFTGLLFGFSSLWKIERLLENSMSKRKIRLLSSLFLFLGSFGIYLGRYLRLNSWDLVHHPFSIFTTILNTMHTPVENSRAWGMTLFMGVFLNMIYWSFLIIPKIRTKYK